MTPRERVDRAIHFQTPDRIPHYLPDAGPNDILWAAPWTLKDAQPPDRQPWTRQGRLERRTDAWGVVWERTADESETMGEAKSWPLETLSRHTDYVFPDRNHPDYYHNYHLAIQNNHQQKYVLGVMGFASLHECTHNLMGLENLFMAYHDEPDALNAWLERLADKQRQSIRLMAKLGCDGVMAYDDWGLQDRLMVSRNTIQDVYLPHYHRNWSLAHDLGMDVWMHSCGHILDILPDFLEAGLDVIQMDQQMNMGLDTLSQRFGGRLAFWCPADIQYIMTRSKPEIIVAYVRRMIDTLGGHNGGLISMAYTTPEALEIPEVNIHAMCRAFREFGVY
jgi:hypothetical protein